MLDENGIPPMDRGGALRLDPFLTPAQRDELYSLPPLWADRDAAIEAHRALAERFLPRARRVLGASGVAWPTAFEEATRRHLATSLGLYL
jgi:hypothetical protein